MLSLDPLAPELANPCSVIEESNTVLWVYHHVGLHFRLMVQQNREPDYISSLSVFLCCVVIAVTLCTACFVVSY